MVINGRGACFSIYFFRSESSKSNTIYNSFLLNYYSCTANILGKSKCFKMLNSRIAVLGIPSSRASILIFLIATGRLVSLSYVLNT